jgi:acetyl esterase/lipase
VNDLALSYSWRSVRGCRLRRTLLILALAVSPALVFAPAARADEPKVEPKVELLWPSGAPGAKGMKETDRPNLTIFLPDPDKATGAAAIICPGGGYGHLAEVHEGSDVAKWLNSLGIAGFVLKYRLATNGYHHPAPLDDVQRAVRLVRSRAAEWKLDPQKIGVVGFSAGGHLASSVGTHFDKGKTDAADAVDRASCRPDFLVLCYPVISFVGKKIHQGSKDNLLGKKPDPELVKLMSNETQVTAETPPTFIFQTNEDKSVPAENAVAFYLALREANVPAELHIYEPGRHGIGLAKDNEDLKGWPDLCGKWLSRRGLVKK